MHGLAVGHYWPDFDLVNDNLIRTENFFFTCYGLRIVSLYPANINRMIDHGFINLMQIFLVFFSYKF